MTDEKQVPVESEKEGSGFFSYLMRRGKLINRKNLRILFKALREEPPSLILENFIQLLRHGHGQSPFSNKFYMSDPDLKAYVLECRKEAGILKVVVWAMAKAGIKNIWLSMEKESISASPVEIVKPELSAQFAEYSDFVQKGYSFQVPFTGQFDQISLNLSDHSDQDIKMSIGKDFTYPPAKGEIIENLSIPTSIQELLFVFHNWNSESDPGGINNLKKQIEQVSRREIDWLICSEEPVDISGNNQGIFVDRAGLNKFLKKEDGPSYRYVVLLDWDTDLPEGFFEIFAQFAEEEQAADIIYFDEHLKGAAGGFYSPTFKPAHSEEYLAGANYIGSNFCVSTGLGNRLNWFAEMDTGSGAYNFLLRALTDGARFERLPGLQIGRPDKGQEFYDRKAAAEVKARTFHFSKYHVAVHPGIVPGSSEVLRPVSGNPKVSIIIPFKDQLPLLRQCLESLIEKTTYKNIEVLLISNNSEAEDTYAYLDEVTREYPYMSWHRRDHPFNYSQLNNWAAERAEGEFLLLLNNDVEVITSDWISRMLSYFSAERVGAVGVKLLYPDHTVQHAGVITGIGGVAGHAHKHYPDHYDGYEGRANKVQNLSACTAACLMVRKSVFDQVGGLDEVNLPVAFNDVDLCLKIHDAGYRIVYTPFVKLLHYESISRGAEDTLEKQERAKKEIAFFRKKWRAFIKAGDPYYHPALSTRMADFEDKEIMGI